MNSSLKFWFLQICDIHMHSNDLLANKEYYVLYGKNLYFMRNYIPIKTERSYRVSKQITV